MPLFSNTRQLLILLLAAFLGVLSAASQVLPQSGDPSTGLTLLEAVKTTLSRQPGIHLEKETVRFNEGILQQETGFFDPLLIASGGQSRTNQPLPAGSTDSSGSLVSNEKADTSSLGLSVKKTLRNGIILKPSVSMNRTDDSVLSPTTQNYATVSFALTVPLLRGWGQAATAGREMAARKARDASLLQFRHTTARLVLETVSAYWNYMAAVIRLKELKKSESRAEEYVSMVKALVEHGERPGADVQAVVANFAAKVALRIAGEQAWEEARQKLGLAMGLSLEEFDRLTDPSSPLPSVPDQWVKNLASTSLVAQSLTRRADYLASKETVEFARILLEAEKTGLLPYLDLEFSAGYSGLDEGQSSTRFVTSFGQNVPGPNASAMLIYKWPVGNNEAQGRILQKDAAYRKEKINSEDLSRKIASSISLILSSVTNTIAEAARIRQAVLIYEVALTNERKKVQLGTSTFLDLIVMEDRLREAILVEISARFRFADALARLRFEAGLLLAGEGERAMVRLEDLTSLPPEFNERDKQ